MTYSQQAMRVTWFTEKHKNKCSFAITKTCHSALNCIINQVFFMACSYDAKEIDESE